MHVYPRAIKSQSVIFFFNSEMYAHCIIRKGEEKQNNKTLNNLPYWK